MDTDVIARGFDPVDVGSAQQAVAGSVLDDETLEVRLCCGATVGCVRAVSAVEVLGRAGAGAVGAERSSSREAMRWRASSRDACARTRLSILWKRSSSKGLRR